MFHILLSCDSQGSMECIYVCMYEEAIKFNNDEGIEFMFTKLKTSDNISGDPFFLKAITSPGVSPSVIYK